MQFHSSTFAAKALGCLLVLAMAAGFCRLSIPRPVAFENIMELKDFAVSNGLYFHSGNKNGVVRFNLLIADHPILLDDLPGLANRNNCGLTPAWRGVLWVCQSGGYIGLPECLEGKRRLWGNVFVAGDGDLMDRIETLYQNQ